MKGQQCPPRSEHARAASNYIPTQKTQCSIYLRGTIDQALNLELCRDGPLSSSASIPWSPLLQEGRWIFFQYGRSTVSQKEEHAGQFYTSNISIMYSLVGSRICLSTIYLDKRKAETLNPKPCRSVPRYTSIRHRPHLKTSHADTEYFTAI